MRKFLLYTIVILGITGLFSCDDDFNILDEYQDITIVYGLLNPDSTTYIKINKAFLGEDNALVMARVEDSSLYRKKLQVTLEGWQNNDLQQSYQLDTISIGNKEDGIFYNPYQLLYYTNEPLNSEYNYKIQVLVNDNKTVTAETGLIGDFSIIRPIAAYEYINFLTNENIMNYFEFMSPANGKRFDALIRFNYKEKSLGQDTITRYFNWGLGTIIADNTEGNREFRLGYKPVSFYSLCEQNIPYDDAAKEQEVVYREPLSVDFIISVANEEFNTYMEVNGTSSGIIQVKPEYTNINNGLGLFASRYNKKMVKLLHNEALYNLRQLNLKF